MKAAIIGFGRFGRLFFEYFRDDFSFSLYDKNFSTRELQRLSKLKEIRPHSLNESEIIFLTVPISSIESVAKMLQSNVSVKSLIVEMCSVKEYPLKILKHYLPKNFIVGLHFLFGPDSVENSLEGHQAILVSDKFRSEKLNYLLNSLQQKKIKLFKMNATEHDKLMAFTLCLTQFLGRALDKMKLPTEGIGTKGYFDLLKIVERTKRDTLQLFIDINSYNKFSKKMRSNLINQMKNLDERLSKISSN
ncbi:MAG: prephenate dehydrogenase/arogenate dehydrogenase family protein [Ignavibacterium sp.]|nr:prephenate dehydrogenase/arogenate dehydrogenase family protein [Ignavibacterium sp.]